MRLAGLVSVVSSVVGFLLLTTISILLSQPLQSSTVRVRANYLPCAVSLGHEDHEDADGQPSTPVSASASASARRLRDARGLLFHRAEPAKIGPVTSGVVGMAKRVVRLEGWSGLYRGSFPVLLQMLCLTLIGSVLLAPFVPDGAMWKKAVATGDIGTPSLAFYLLIAVFVDLPMSIITHRTIVHPYPLQWTQPAKNMRVLLSPIEARHPWRLYFLPGMASVCVLHTLFVAFGIPFAHKICFGSGNSNLTPSTWTGNSGSLPADDPTTIPAGPRFSAKCLAAYLAWTAVTIIITVPIQCAKTRLSTQRPSESITPDRADMILASHQAGATLDHEPSSPGDSLHEEEEDEHAPLRPRPTYPEGQTIPSISDEAQEPVVVLRPCASSSIEADAGSGTVPPYTGLLDCLRTMVAEEGVESIYRGWGVSVFFLALSFLSSLLV